MLAYCLLFAKRGGQTAALYAGLFLGLATMTEYTALVSAFIAFLYVLLVRSERPRAPSLLLGSLVGLLVTMIYHQVCFGGFFTTATSMSNPEFLDPTRWGGTFGPFDYTVAWRLLFSSAR